MDVDLADLDVSGNIAAGGEDMNIGRTRGEAQSMGYHTSIDKTMPDGSVEKTAPSTLFEAMDISPLMSGGPFGGQIKELAYNVYTSGQELTNAMNMIDKPNLDPQTRQMWEAKIIRLREKNTRAQANLNSRKAGLQRGFDSIKNGEWGDLGGHKGFLIDALEKHGDKLSPEQRTEATRAIYNFGSGGSRAALMAAASVEDTIIGGRVSAYFGQREDTGRNKDAWDKNHQKQFRQFLNFNGEGVNVGNIVSAKGGGGTDKQKGAGIDPSPAAAAASAEWMFNQMMQSGIPPKDFLHKMANEVWGDDFAARSQNPAYRKWLNQTSAAMGDQWQAAARAKEGGKTYKFKPENYTKEFDKAGENIIAGGGPRAGLDGGGTTEGAGAVMGAGGGTAGGGYRDRMGEVTTGTGDDKKIWRIDPETGDWQQKNKVPGKEGQFKWDFIDPSQERMMESEILAEMARIDDVPSHLVGDGLTAFLENKTNAELEQLANIRAAAGIVEEDKKRRGTGGSRTLAGGFIPNFAKKFAPNFSREGKHGMYRGYIPSPNRQLEEAKDREVTALMERGYSRGEASDSLYVQEHPSITSNNLRIKDIAAKGYVPNYGVGVFNRIDEPMGGHQGVDRAKSEGANINTYGRRGSVPSFSNNIAGNYVPNFEAAAKQINSAAESFGEIAKAAGKLTDNLGNKRSGQDEIEQMISFGEKSTHTANINVNIDGSVQAIPNAIAQAVIDWSKGNILKGGGYFPPNRKR
jgi:hypothetical protein